MNPSPQHDPEIEHALPRWVIWVQDNLLLSFLIAAEAYLLGTLMSLGWVRDIEDPSHWGIYHGVGVILFFAAGAAAAGIALRSSVKAAACFSRGAIGTGMFNMLGLVVFSACEIWASLSERSTNLHPTPADSAVLSLIGVQSAPVSPTVVIVALLLPFASLYYGFSQQKAAQTSLETERAKLERELALQPLRAQLRVQKLAGARHAVAAALGSEVSQVETPAVSPSDRDDDAAQAADEDGDPFYVETPEVPEDEPTPTTGRRVAGMGAGVPGGTGGNRREAARDALIAARLAQAYPYYRRRRGRVSAQELKQQFHWNHQYAQTVLFHLQQGWTPRRRAHG